MAGLELVPFSFPRLQQPEEPDIGMDVQCAVCGDWHGEAPRTPASRALPAKAAQPRTRRRHGPCPDCGAPDTPSRGCLTPGCSNGYSRASEESLEGAAAALALARSRAGERSSGLGKVEYAGRIEGLHAR